MKSEEGNLVKNKTRQKTQGNPEGEKSNSRGAQKLIYKLCVNIWLILTLLMHETEAKQQR